MKSFFKIPALWALATLQAFSNPLPKSLEHVQSLDGIHEYRLSSNGLSILLMPIQDLPVATVMVTYKVGSRNEVTGTTGATHILEHMMFKGTKRFNLTDGNDYSSQMERIGAIANATTWLDRTNYYATLPSEYVPMTVELEADRMRNLLLDEAELASEMAVVHNEYEQGENSPVRTLINEVFAAAYMAHPYGHPTIGWESDINSITVDKLRHYYDTYYWPENAVVTIIGGFDKAATLEAIATHYGALAPAPQPIPEITTQEPEQTGPRRVTIRRAGQTGVVLIGFKVPEGAHNDWAALSLLQQVLGANRTGRLYRALEDKGLANATFAFAPQLRDPGLFILGAYLTPDATHEAVEAIILEEIENLIADGISADELARAQSVLQAAIFYGRDGPFRIADQINDTIAMGDWSAYLNLPRAIQEVPTEAVQDVAARYLVDAGSTTGWFVPGQSNGPRAPSQAPLGPVHYRAPGLDLPNGQANNAGNQLAQPSELASDALPRVNFSAQMKRAQIGPIELVAIHMPIKGVVSFVGSLAAGDSLSPPDAPLLAGLTANMLDKGTRQRDRFQIAERLETLGASISFASDAQSLRFSGRFLRSDAVPVINLLAEQLREPAFDPDVFATLKARQKGGLLQAIDNPDYRAGALLSRHLYPENHPNHSLPIDKLIEELERAEIEDVREFHVAHYGPETLRMVFVGDVDFEQLKAAIGNAFEDWAGGSAYPILETAQLDHGALREQIQIDDKASASVRLGFNTRLQRTDPDYLPFMLGNYILGGGFNSRLMTEVRQNRGLTYGIRTRHDGDILTPGHWLLAASFSPSVVEAGLQATREVLQAWYEAGVTEQEVAAAIEALSGTYLVGLSTTARVAGQVHSFMERGFPPEYIDTYPLDLHQLTAEAVNQAIRQFFDPEQLVEIVAGSLDQVNGATDERSGQTRIELRIDTPDAGWSLKIESVYRTPESIAVISRLSRNEQPAPQVISTVYSTAQIPLSQIDRPVQHYVIGKSWDWKNTDAYESIESMHALDALLKDAELLYSAGEEPRSSKAKTVHTSAHPIQSGN